MLRASTLTPTVHHNPGCPRHALPQFPRNPDTPNPHQPPLSTTGEMPAQRKILVMALHRHIPYHAEYLRHPNRPIPTKRRFTRSVARISRSGTTHCIQAAADSVASAMASAITTPHQITSLSAAPQPLQPLQCLPSHNRRSDRTRSS